MNKKTAVLLINIGTPASTSVNDVRNYLFRFLNDKRVIDLPWLLRKLLVNIIIVPFRARKSAGMYKKLFTDKGSPLLYYQNNLVEKLNRMTSQEIKVYSVMRYSKPFVSDILQEIRKQQPDEIVVVPLFPQYASSTSGSAISAVYNHIHQWNVIPAVRSIMFFYAHPSFLNLFSGKIQACNPSEFDHVLFSYHGLPLRQVKAAHKGISCNELNCTMELHDENKYCYLAQCSETTRLLAEECSLTENQFSMSFQSRLGKNWLEPNTGDVLKQLAQQGKKKVLVVSPSFVTDCLETIVEIGVDYKELFLQNGGERLELVESLNDSDLWAEALLDIIKGSQVDLAAKI